MVWLVANLPSDEFEYALRSAFEVLSDLYQKQTGELIELPEYDGTDVRDLLREREGRGLADPGWQGSARQQSGFRTIWSASAGGARRLTLQQPPRLAHTLKVISPILLT